MCSGILGESEREMPLRVHVRRRPKTVVQSRESEKTPKVSISTRKEDSDVLQPNGFETVLVCTVRRETWPITLVLIACNCCALFVLFLCTFRSKSGALFSQIFTKFSHALGDFQPRNMGTLWGKRQKVIHVLLKIFSLAPLASCMINSTCRCAN